MADAGRCGVLHASFDVDALRPLQRRDLVGVPHCFARVPTTRPRATLYTP
jgi:hypothetical protein